MEGELRLLAKAFEDIGEDGIAEELERGCYPITAISKVEGRALRMLGVCKQADDLLMKLQGREQ